MIPFIILIPIIPLISFLILGLFGKNFSKNTVAYLACGSILISLVLSVALFFQIQSLPSHAITLNLFDWISSGSMHIPFSFLIDPLSVLFLLIITGIGFLIHVYSIGYRSEDQAFSRFFAYLNLFIFF